MRMRTSYGAALPLVVASSIVLIIVGIGLFLLAKIVGGNIELQHATDSGNLNVAKQVVKVGTNINTLSTTIKENFGAFTDADAIDAASGSATQNQIIDLRTYNGCVAQTILVALNAAADGGGNNGDAARHARALTYALEGVDSNPFDDASLSYNVSRYLGTAAIVNDRQFAATGSANSLRMLGQGPQQQAKVLSDVFKVAYVNRNAATNITVDANVASNLPHTKFSLPTVNGYLSGYADNALNIDPGDGLAPLKIRAVPTNPQGQPHLISQTDFANSTSDKSGFLQETLVPPNAFQSAANSREATTGKDLRAVANSTISTLNKTAPLSIPNGYIEIINPPGFQSSSRIPLVGNIWNNELMGGTTPSGTPSSGITIGLNSSGNSVCFTTDDNALRTLIAYNKGTVVTPPSLKDLSGNALFYDAQGNPIQSLAQLTGVTKPSQPCTTTNSAYGPGQVPCPECNSLLAAFNKAYTTDGGYQRITPGEQATFGNSTYQFPEQVQELAVESFNDNVVQAYPICWSGSVTGVYSGSNAGLYASVNAAGYGIWLPSGQPITQFKAPLPFTFSVSTPGAAADSPLNRITGLRNFNHNFTRTGADGLVIPQPKGANVEGYYVFSHADTPLNYFAELGLDSPAKLTGSSIFQKLLQRCREIVPDTSVDELQNVLQSTTLDLGEVGYIYRNTQSGRLQFVKTGRYTIIPGTSSYQLQALGGPLPPGFVTPNGTSKDTADAFGYAPDGIAEAFFGPQYDPVANALIDVSSTDSPTGKGNCLIHSRLFEQVGADPTAQDFVRFTTSSGFRNDLGRLVFGNSVTGQSVFSEPN